MIWQTKREIFENAIGIMSKYIVQMKNINAGHFQRNQLSSGRQKKWFCIIYYSVLLCWFLLLFLFMRSFWFEFKLRTVRQTRAHFYAICLLANQYAKVSTFAMCIWIFCVCVMMKLHQRCTYISICIVNGLLRPDIYGWADFISRDAVWFSMLFLVLLLSSVLTVIAPSNAKVSCKACM